MSEEVKEEIKNTKQPDMETPNTEETVSETLAETGQDTNNLSENDPPDELTQMKAELADQKDKYLRLAAEFDNYRKRSAKELREFLKTAGQDVIRDLLPVLDDIKRANKAFEQDKNQEAFTQGMLLIREKLTKILQHKGLKEIESIGKDFDIHFHEAIAEIPAATEDQKGKIVDEVESGYTLNGSIIRYAKVVVGK
jgi:molecular chaperone GrpE